MQASFHGDMHFILVECRSQSFCFFAFFFFLPVPEGLYIAIKPPPGLVSPPQAHRVRNPKIIFCPCPGAHWAQLEQRWHRTSGSCPVPRQRPYLLNHQLRMVPSSPDKKWKQGMKFSSDSYKNTLILQRRSLNALIDGNVFAVVFREDWNFLPCSSTAIN